MNKLYPVFENLPTPDVDGTRDGAVSFSADLIDDAGIYRIGKDQSSRPILIISASQQNQVEVLPAPVLLEYLVVNHGVPCRIFRNDNSYESGVYTIISCLSDSRIMHSIFVELIGVLLPGVSPNPSTDEISTLITNIVKLFRSLSMPPKKSIQGLWSELFLISQSKKPISLIRAWHRNPDDRYDFCIDNEYIEVKSTASATREHHFSLEQLTPPDGTTVVIASMMIEKDQAGSSIWDLLTRLRKKISREPDLALQLEEVVNRTLGTNWKFALEDRFDERNAKRSLAYYSVKDIPCIDSEIPAEVRNVRFVSDISAVPPLLTTKVFSNKSLFSCLPNPTK